MTEYVFFLEKNEFLLHQISNLNVKLLKLTQMLQETRWNFRNFLKCVLSSQNDFFCDISQVINTRTLCTPLTVHHLMIVLIINQFLYL